MQVNCPNCNQIIEQYRPPNKTDPGAGESWICYKCTTAICVSCYIQHMENSHSDVYMQQKQHTGNHKKNKKRKI